MPGLLWLDAGLLHGALPPPAPVPLAGADPPETPPAAVPATLLLPPPPDILVLASIAPDCSPEARTFTPASLGVNAA